MRMIRFWQSSSAARVCGAPNSSKEPASVAVASRVFLKNEKSVLCPISFFSSRSQNNDSSLIRLENDGHRVKTVERFRAKLYELRRLILPSRPAGRDRLP